MIVHFSFEITLDVFHVMNKDVAIDSLHNPNRGVPSGLSVLQLHWHCACKCIGSLRSLVIIMLDMS